MDAELVLDAAHVDAAVALVVDEHGEAASVGSAFFRACQHEVKVGIAVGDEALHAVEPPAACGFVVGGLEHHALEVGAGIRLGEVHRHCFAGTDAGDETGVLVLVAEFIEGFDAVLQAPDVAEAGIARCHQLGAHGVGRDGEVESAVHTGHGHTVQPGLHHGVQIGRCARGVTHAVALMVGAFQVNALGIVGNGGSGQFARDVEHAVVVVHRVVEVERRIVVGVLVAEISFLQFHDALHQRVVQLKAQFCVVSIIVCHVVTCCFACNT